MKLLLISDTHARPLPSELWAVVDAVDVVVHAGDWVTTDLLDDLEAVASRVVGCYGNNDGPELRARLPEVARVELDGVRLAVVHETGSKERRDERMRRAYPDTHLLVFGHSHIPWDTTHSGLRLLNPGSPTDRRQQPNCTWMTCRLADGAVHDVVVHRLPRDQAGASAKRR